MAASALHSHTNQVCSIHCHAINNRCSMQAMNTIELESMASFESNTHRSTAENTPSSMENTLIRERGPEATTGRVRSLSVATAKPSVETVVVKAKRAASSLWLLLHSQVGNYKMVLGLSSSSLDSTFSLFISKF